MRAAEMVLVEMQDQLKLIIVEGAELTESLLDLLHEVHVLRRLSIHGKIAGVSCVN